MFPIPFNFPFRKSDGTLSTIGAEIGGGGGSAVDTTARERANAAYTLAETADTKATNAANAASTADGKAVTAQNTANDAFETMGVMGAKNLNKYPYDNTTKTTNGITFTDIGDGTIKIDGTSTNAAQFFCHLRTQADREGTNLILPNGTYILSGSSNLAPGVSLLVNITLNNTQSQLAVSKNGEEVSFIANGDDYYSDKIETGLIIYVPSGVTCNNVIFKPMLRLATDPDDTFAPYAKTNKELTDDLANLPSGGGGLYSKTFTTELTSANVAKKRTIKDSNNVDTCVWEVANIINQNDYIPIGVIVGDTYTGYCSVGSIQKTGNDYTVEILSTYSGNSYDEFSPLTVIYAPTSGVTPIT